MVSPKNYFFLCIFAANYFFPLSSSAFFSVTESSVLISTDTAFSPFRIGTACLFGFISYAAASTAAAQLRFNIIN